MALYTSTRRSVGLSCRKTTFGWGGALAVGLAAVGWRSISSHVSCGDFRANHSINASARYNCAFRSFSTSLSRTSFFSALSSSNIMSLIPPQTPPSWEHSAEDIMNLTKASIEKYRSVLDQVGALDAKDANFESVSVCWNYISHISLREAGFRTC